MKEGNWVSRPNLLLCSRRRQVLQVLSTSLSISDLSSSSKSCACRGKGRSQFFFLDRSVPAFGTKTRPQGLHDHHHRRDEHSTAVRWVPLCGSNAPTRRRVPSLRCLCPRTRTERAEPQSPLSRASDGRAGANNENISIFPFCYY